MRGLIGDLLDAGRIDSGTLSVTPEPTELADLVERARDTFIGGGGRHGIAVDLPANLPRALADQRRIVQVLNNLFANAARYAPESSSIRVTAARADAHVAVAVADAGRGVAPELLPRLFDKHAGAGSKAGYGLGLAVCKGLVGSPRRPHPGRRATAPGAVPPSPSPCPRPTRPTPGRSRHRRRARARANGRPSLVVDDDPRSLRFVRETLSAAGYAPRVTGDPGTARPAHPQREAASGAARPGPARAGRHRVDAESPRTLRPAGDLHLRLRPRRDRRCGAGKRARPTTSSSPFRPPELVARVRAALRRHEAPQPFVLGALSIDFGRRRVTVGGEPVAFTATEYELLRVLALNAGRVMPLQHAAAPGLERACRRRCQSGAHLRAQPPPQARGRRGGTRPGSSNERGVGYLMAGPEEGAAGRE